MYCRYGHRRPEIMEILPSENPVTVVTEMLSEFDYTLLRRKKTPRTVVNVMRGELAAIRLALLRRKASYYSKRSLSAMQGVSARRNGFVDFVASQYCAIPNSASFENHR